MGMEENNTLLLESFETDEEVKVVERNEVRAERSSDHATERKSSLKAVFEGTGASLIFQAGKAYGSSDWSHYGYLTFDIFNAGSKDAELGVSLHPIIKDYSWRMEQRRPGEEPIYVSRFAVHAGTSHTPKIPFQDYVGMRALPPIDGKFHPTAGWRASYLNLASVESFAITMESPNEPVELYFDNFHLLPGVPLVGMIDEFGQYTGAEWHGKVHSREDLRKQAVDEEKLLDSYERPAYLDKYGGYTKGPKLKATGWFRTEKVDGKWWFVTPEGHIFWSVGANAVYSTFREYTIVEGREYMFEWLPEADSPYAEFYHPRPSEPERPEERFYRSYPRDERARSRIGFNFYALNVMRKYGRNYVERWMEVNEKRHKCWGLNTIGPWADIRVCEAEWAPFLFYIPPIDLKAAGMHRALDPDFPEELDRIFAEATSRWRNNPWLIGYFVGYEMPWGNSDFEIPDRVMREKGGSLEKRALVNMLSERYEADIGNLNRAWGTSFESFDDLYLKPVEHVSNLSEAAAADMREFLRRIAERYFKCIAESLKRHDPNHLFLGCRFHGQRPLIVFKECAKHADVVTVNIWGRGVKDIFDPTVTPLWDAIDKPVLILGFNLGALDRGMFHPGIGLMLSSQAERGEAYSHFVEAAVKHPLFVGAHTYKYIDQPPSGTTYGGFENYNDGFVTITDTPHEDFLAKVKETHHRIYETRLQS